MSCLFLPVHSSYDRYSLSSKNYEPHAFYRKHFWCFPHLERRIYTYLVCFCQRTLATIDIPFRARILRTARVLQKAFLVFSTFRTKNIHISCLFLTAHSSQDRYSLSSRNYPPHEFYTKHFRWFFTFRTGRIYTYIFCFCQRTRTRLHSKVVYC